MQIRASVAPEVYEKWKKLLKDKYQEPKGLMTLLILEASKANAADSPKKSHRGPGRPADSALAKSAKQKVGWQIGVLQRMKDEGTKLPNFDRAVVAMSALMEAGLWQRALDYQKSNWWRQFAPPAEAIEPDWQKWLEEEGDAE